MRGLALLVFLGWAMGAQAQQLVFSPDATEACIADSSAPEGCAGASATACMEDTPGGYTTVGMGGCLELEWLYWDARLNTAYSTLRADLIQLDREMREYGSMAPSQADALRAMQRAWIPFRDARCDYERSQWGGGTGGGPATVSCLLETTARQALYLEAQGAAQ